MPLIIGEGLGRDDQIIIQRIVGFDIVGSVTVEDRVVGFVEIEDVPFGTVVADAIPVAGEILVENQILGTVVTNQQIVGYVSEEGPCMSLETNHVKMFLRDDRTLTVTANYKDEEGNITGPVDLNGAKIWMTVKQRSGDPDDQALFMKRNTAAGGSDDEIKILTPTTNGQAEIYIIPADTEEMDPGTYQYDIQVKLSNNKTYTITRGKITFSEDVTKATT
jgi:hypothetical protein